MKFDHHITDFVDEVRNEIVEIYNEFSLQHELGIYLRNELKDCKIQFERNVVDFKLVKSDFVKKEIDITITSKDMSDRLSAIELKYPRNGQVPEQIYSFCKDISFLEQLVSSGFKSAYFLVIVDDPLFYSGKDNDIYGLFRSGKKITGEIRKPTGLKDEVINIKGSFTASWHPISEKMKYCLIEIG